MKKAILWMAMLVDFGRRESCARRLPALRAASLTVIRAGTLIDGASDTPRKNQLIFVRGEHIEKVTDGSAEIPPGAKVIDLSAATVLPGLIDSHTHIFLWGEDPAKGGYDVNILKAGIALRAARATFAMRRALEQGFTTLRDLETEGAGYGDVEIKQAIEEGTIPGPRLFLRDAGDFHDRRVQPGRLRAGTGHAERRATDRWAGGSAEGGAATARSWRRLDQGLHDAPVVGGQTRESWFRSRR